MKHYLITRFNVSIKSWNSTKNGDRILDDEWMSDRFDLFFNYCLPSVKNQSNKNFKWIVFFDTNTKSEYLEKIKKIETDFTTFIPIFINDGNKIKQSLLDFIKSDYNDEDKYIITSRLDNDDSIHEDFIAIIQSLSSKIDNNNSVIDLQKGIQLIELDKKNIELRNIKIESNPFISLVEYYNFKTIISESHNYWSKYKNIITYNQKSMWIQVIHSKNKLNTKNNKSLITSRVKLNEFGLNSDNYKLPNRFDVIIRNFKSIAFFLLKKMTKGN